MSTKSTADEEAEYQLAVQLSIEDEHKRRDSMQNEIKKYYDSQINEITCRTKGATITVPPNFPPSYVVRQLDPPDIIDQPIEEEQPEEDLDDQFDVLKQMAEQAKKQRQLTLKSIDDRITHLLDLREKVLAIFKS